jgi:signal transduction histidine kinase
VTGRSDDAPRAPLPVDLERLLHDLRGPLNAAVMHLEVLKRLQGEDATARASMASIQGELERMAAMLPLAFRVCALEMGAVRPVSLRAVVETAVDPAERKRVMIDEDGGWPDVDGDECLLRFAVGEILRNALEAGGDDGEARVRVDPAEHDGVTLSVRDNGPGFKTRNPAAAVRLMATTKPDRAGIGLLIAQRVARLHGGSLAIETQPGGAVVRLTLRRRRPTA